MPDAEGVYYARNRWLQLPLQRWTSADPNATGLLLTFGSRYFGASWFSESCDSCWASAPCGLAGIEPWISAWEGYADGMNLHLAFGSNPIMGRDPDGRSAYVALLASILIGEDAYLDKAQADLYAKGVAIALAAVLATFYADEINTAIQEIAGEMGRVRAVPRYSRRQCKNLQAWCNWYGLDRDCWGAMRYCENNGKWHPEHPPLPPQADPDAPPPGYGN